MIMANQSGTSTIGIFNKTHSQKTQRQTEDVALVGL